MLIMNNTWFETGIPLGDWVELFVKFLLEFESIWYGIKKGIIWVVSSFESIFFFFPPWFIILFLAGLAYWSGKKVSLTIFTIIGLGLIWNLDFWENMVYTLSLVLTAAIISVVLGIPTGILAVRKRNIEHVITPILDFMQTMPAFVYLIPAVFFFGIGAAPGVIASVIFSMPPTIRLTILGIKQVPKELIEATEAFGSTSNQKLIKVQLPLAKKTIMAGVNQSIMLALSMVVIASMVGARGLGRDVLQAVTQNKIGLGVEAGISVVILAILLDRITQNFGNK